jgi:hypothetical protein
VNLLVRTQCPVFSRETEMHPVLVAEWNKKSLRAKDSLFVCTWLASIGGGGTNTMVDLLLRNPVSWL